MPDRFLKITIVMLSVAGGLATAAVAPMSPKELEPLQLTSEGKVLEVKSRIESRSQKGLVNATGSYHQLQVTAVSKKDVEREEDYCFRLETGHGSSTGLQGHSPLLKGQVVTIHVARRRSQLRALPNGIGLRIPNRPFGGSWEAAAQFYLRSFRGKRARSFKPSCRFDPWFAGREADSRI